MYILRERERDKLREREMRDSERERNERDLGGGEERRGGFRLYNDMY